MYFEIFVEDKSGAVVLSHLLPKILSQEHSYNIRHYNGIGAIPKRIVSPCDVGKRLLLQKLPGILQGYGKFCSGSNDIMLIVVCDLDGKDEDTFRNELNTIYEACNPKPRAKFCFAIEEIEAWLLGDQEAVLEAYPRANKRILRQYEQDSICGTWEVLADALYSGGAAKLKNLQKSGSYRETGKQKIEWAENIAPRIDISRNKSPSFRMFLDVFPSS